MLNMDNRQEALEKIYKRTYAKAYVITKQFIKNEEDALDVLQEAYISVFTHMESLQDESKLDKWVNMIVANRCKDWLRKKQVVLFSDMGEEAEDDYEATIEEDKLEFLPEASVDYAETKRLMAEILDTLSEEQKMCILMYYYDERSVNEIAEGLGCSTGTVKSRLNYARKKIKEEVELLEKKGTKLYGIAPLPFIVWMLKGTEANASDSLNAAGVLQKVVGTSVSGKGTIVNNIYGARNITRNMVFGILKTKTAIAIISSVVVLGVGTTTYLAVRNDSNGNQHNVKKETVSESDEEVVKEDELNDTTETSTTERTDKEETTGKNETITNPETSTTERTDKEETTGKNETITNPETSTTERTDKEEATDKNETITNPETSQPSTQPTTPTGTQAGLYQNDVLVKEWNTLIAEGILTVNNGILTSGYSYQTDINSSSDKLVGTLIIDKSVKEIGQSGLTKCKNLTTVVLPDSIKTIHYNAFDSCSNLKKINIPNSVTTIDQNAFSRCTSLKSISIPDSVEVIDMYIFWGCTGLTSVNIPHSVSYINAGVFGLCSSLTTITIPDNIKSIGSEAFVGCTSLTSVNIPNSVTYICNHAFAQCTNLKTITIPDSVKTIDMGAFLDCPNLTINYKSTEAAWNGITFGDGAVPATVKINYMQ